MYSALYGAGEEVFPLPLTKKAQAAQIVLIRAHRALPALYIQPKTNLDLDLELIDCAILNHAAGFDNLKPI